MKEDIKIWITRHGNRIDFIEDGWQLINGYDPHLSADGVTQAKKTGAQLSDQSIAYIYSSPFSRTLETAHYISQIIDAPILIENGFTEWLNPEWFSHDPVLKTIAESKMSYPNVDTNYSSFKSPKFPETYQDCLSRTSETMERISQEMNENILIVTHCLVIPGISKPLVGYYFDGDYDLCSLSQIRLEKSEWACKIKNDTMHLK